MTAAPPGSRGAALAVCLAAIVPYLPTLNDYFVQDDFGVVWLLASKPWWYFPRWFVTTWMDDIWGFTPDEIRPFPAVTYQLAAAWDAGSPLLNHVMNVALHAANGLLVLAMARSAAGVGAIAGIAAAVGFVLLPNQAESVAWVTGRVDSLPALVYVGSFLAYARWRTGAGPGWYWGAAALCFVALFTKQTAITLGPLLVLYDLVVTRRPVRATWGWVRPYVPFAALTVAYLALRYVLFGELVRESQLTTSGVAYFASLVGRHLQRVLFGAVPGGSPLLWWLAAAVVALALWARPRIALFFGVLWFAVHVAPVLVAAYESPRHVYLASIAWTMLLALALDAAVARRWFRAPAMLAVAGLLAAYAVQLGRVVGDWEQRAMVSHAAVRDVEREAQRARPGTLIVAAAPARSWEWAAPFVLRRPFAAADLDSRVRLVTPQALHCCRGQWDAFTRATLREWLAAPDRPPAVALRWDGRSGALFRLSEAEEPYLRSLIEVMAQTDSAAALDRAVRELASRLPPASRQTDPER